MHSWMAGCAADTYLDALMEVEATQDMNVRTEEHKSYHLMLSFRPEDEAKLTPGIAEEMERRFAGSLGFEEHQRCCGIHKNTNNVHIHIAYNMIHPETFCRHDPFRDFFALARTCREIEKEYDLIVDPGIDIDREPTRTNVRAQTMEAHSGQESFDSYVQRHKAALLEGLRAAQDWQDVHQMLAVCGVGIKPGPGNRGMALYDLHGRHHAKASSLGREVSGPALMKRFGTFAAAEKFQVQELERYDKKPLQQQPDRDQLYQSYLLALEQKKKARQETEELKLKTKPPETEIKAKWQAYRAALRLNVHVSSKDRWTLTQRSYLAQKAEIAALAAPYREKQAEIRARFPFSSWGDYLRHMALEGNEVALDILRSKKELFQSKAGEGKTLRQNVDQAGEKESLLTNAGMATRDKKKLLAALKLQERAGQEIKASISPSGVLILALASGGAIRDSGKEIHFSAFDPKAKDVAAEYARIKWGQMNQARENKIVFTPKKKGLGLER